MAYYATPFSSSAGRSYAPPTPTPPGGRFFLPKYDINPYMPQTRSQFKLPSGGLGGGADNPVIIGGLYKSSLTGQPWTGPIHGLDGNPTGLFATNGRLTAAPTTAQTSDAPTVVKIVKQPEIAAATTGLLQQQQAQSAQTAKDFTAYLDEARTVNAANKIQLGKDQAALDTTGIDNELRANNASYRTAQDATTGNIAARNKDFATQTQETIDRLTQSNADYEKAAQAVAGQAVIAAQKRNDLYQLTSGTPTSGSGNMSNRAIKAYLDVNTPLQRELADRRYGQIANIERPYQNQLYGNDQALFARESGLASDYAGRNENTARYLQDLKMRTAGMSRQMAADYLRSLNVPFEIAQRIIAGDIANLTGIAALDALANEYTFTQPFDPNRLPTVQQYSPSYPTPSRSGGVPYIPGGGATTTGTGASVVPQLPDWVVRQRAMQSGIPNTPAQAGSGGGYTVNPDGSFNSIGSFANMDWNAAYANGLNPGQQNYADAIARAYQ